MKLQTAVFLFAFITLNVLLHSSCTAEYFHTPNDLYRMKGTVYLKDGTKRDGALTVLFENGVVANEASVSFIPAGGQTEEHLRFDDIAAYVINGATYVPKNVNLYTAGVNHNLFVKKLLGESGKIQLYELEQKRKSNDEGEETKFYFISVPAYSPTDLIELHSSLLVPSFDEKMSAFVADCPPLAAKIKAKADGYFYTQLSLQYKKLDVMKRIVQEYAACTAK